VSGLLGQQAGLFDITATAGDLVLNAGFPDQLLAEGYSLVGAGTHQFQAALGHAYKTHCILETAWAKATLGYLEAAALALDHIAHWHTHIVEQEFRFTAG
jgi:hypothetical protein